MQVITSSTLTVLHDGQFWVGICEHVEEGRYGACRIVFGATEPTDTEIQEFVLRRWAGLDFDFVIDGAEAARPCSHMRIPSAANARRASRSSRRASARRPSKP